MKLIINADNAELAAHVFKLWGEDMPKGESDQCLYRGRLRDGNTQYQAYWEKTKYGYKLTAFEVN